MDGKVESSCKVCGDKASGKHYGVPSCDGCRGFFKRSIRRGLAYHCKESGCCVVDVTRRNQCQACRFKKCLAVNMKRDAVQHERAPRASLSPLSTGPRPGPRAPTYHFPHQPPPYISPTTPLLDLSPYHLIYSQPTFPFHFGVSSRLGLGLSPLGTSPRFSQPVETKVSGPGGEEEVTSSEEAKERDVPQLEVSRHSEETPLQDLWKTADLCADQAMYESAAKLLFLTVKWARSIPSFLQLSFHDQSALLEDSWNDLFILSAAQWALPIDEVWLKWSSLQSESQTKRDEIERETRRLKQAICRLAACAVDHTEYACLKALTLFKSDVTGLRDQAMVELLQEQTLTRLHDYCAARETNRARFGKLLLLLRSVNNLSKDMIEESLFRKTIGNVSMERVLSDMLKSSTTV